MGVSIYWENSQHTAIHLKFTAPWTWDEYESASADLIAMADSVPHTVDILINMTDAGELPADAVLRMGEMYTDDLPNLGEYVFMGAPDGFESLMAVTDRYYTALGGVLDYRVIA
ncbi:MAG: hypothetical protein MUF38_19940 [Anaerolineae bacterium]|jgi:hypothetical protein|nr:hypothetical protein [Anaerolineae bacterium]